MRNSILWYSEKLMLASASAREILSKEVAARDDEVHACQQRIHMLQEEALGHRQQLHTAHAETGGTSATHCNTMQLLQHAAITATRRYTLPTANMYTLRMRKPVALLRHTATRCNHCNTLQAPQHAATLYSLQNTSNCQHLHTAHAETGGVSTTHCYTLKSLQHTAHCQYWNTAHAKQVVLLQHTATQCNHCNTLQHAATHCNYYHTLPTANTDTPHMQKQVALMQSLPHTALYIHIYTCVSKYIYIHIYINIYKWLMSYMCHLFARYLVYFAKKNIIVHWEEQNGIVHWKKSKLHTTQFCIEHCAKIRDALIELPKYVMLQNTPKV